jgi:1-aminocyclopropane-1-carboxylate deaminase/D-cysteine desulfhydrase-like pyridoxal-dependent ACC family enzyme
MVNAQQTAIVQELFSPLFEAKKVRLFLQRDDLLHPEVSGNKFRKLKYNIQNTIEQGYETILTFGGAYSNHIAATAAAAKLSNLKSIGIIRGEEHQPLNVTLQTAVNNGMELHYINRSEYKLKEDTSFLEGLKQQFGEVFIIPEGGTNQLAIKGVAEMKADWDQEYNCIATPFGSGGTSAGIYSVLEEHQQLLIFSALKGDKVGDEFTYILADNNIVDNNNWTMFNQYHFGGYAKVKPELVDFVNAFKKDHHIQLDLIYNGKMLFGLTDLIQQDYFSPGTKILAIHTGGVQGNKGMEERLGLVLH